MSIIHLCLQLDDYINHLLLSDEITKKESTSLKLLKGVICDFVITQMQKRKEFINVSVGTESCVNHDFNNCI